ncbi:hypothetical protein FHG87_020734, partial [Trinorchestia longiramus]
QRLLGGLSSDKEFLSSLLNRRGLTKSIAASSVVEKMDGNATKIRSKSRGDRVGKKEDKFGGRRGRSDMDTEDERRPQRTEGLGSSGGEVAAKAKEALCSLQHLEAFLWQRNPAGVNRTGRAGRGLGPARAGGVVTTGRGSGARRARTQARSEKSKQRTAIVKKVSSVLRKLETLEGRRWAGALREGEMLVEEVREGGGVGGDHELAAVFCRLLVGVGAALPRAGRSEDALALLTDAAHIAHSRDLLEDEQLASEWQGRVLANRGQHKEA